jgi:hypothetical protein
MGAKPLSFQLDTHLLICSLRPILALVPKARPALAATAQRSSLAPCHICTGIGLAPNPRLPRGRARRLPATAKSSTAPAGHAKIPLDSSAVQCSAVQCSAVQGRAGQCRAVQGSAALRCAVLRRADHMVGSSSRRYAVASNSVRKSGENTCRACARAFARVRARACVECAPARVCACARYVCVVCALARAMHTATGRQFGG